MVAAYLIDPARRKYPLDELLEDESITVKVAGANGLAERAVRHARRWWTASSA